MRWLLGCLVLVACSDARSDDGRDALLRIDGAQFYRASLAAGSGGGPGIASASLTGRVAAGGVDGSISGELERSGLAVAVALEGDLGYWIVRAATPLSSAPTLPTFLAPFALSARLRPGPRTLILRGVDGAGRFGPATTRPFEVVDPARPAGRLVISLAWNNQADLDLHVVLPSGIEIDKRNPSEYEPPPVSAGPAPPGAALDGGVLDRDSNARCVLDGQRSENVIWSDTPPSGRYVVRVDTFSLCDAQNATWRVEARLDGLPVGAATGTSTENDLRFEHGRGAGVLALSVDIP